MAVAAAAGLAISAYLTLTHYQALPLACPSGGVVDCALVTQSRYGLIPGTRLPIGFAGLAWFAVSLGLALAGLRARGRALLVAGALVAWGLAGLAAALYLVYVELALLRHLCEWCTATHLLVLGILMLAVRRLQAIALENRDATGMGAPIFDAIRAGDSAAVAAILARDPGQAAATDPDGVSALMHAQYARRADLVALLRAAHPGLDLFEAAALGDVAAVGAALADPDAVRAVAGDGFQALHLAAYFGRLEVVEALLRAGADPDAVAANAAQLRPLHSAAAAGHAEVAERLLRAGADPNARQQGGWTPLHAALLNRDRGLERLLLEHGADPTLKTDDGRTPAALVTDQAD